MRALLLAACALLLTSCATTAELPPATAGPLDSTLRSAGLSTGKIKITGPVTFQVGGTGNTAAPVATDNTKAGQRGGAAATAPQAQATASTEKSGPAWWVLGLVGVVAIAAWEWLSKWLPLGWLFWRKN